MRRRKKKKASVCVECSGCPHLSCRASHSSLDFSASAVKFEHFLAASPAVKPTNSGRKKRWPKKKKQNRRCLAASCRHALFVLGGTGRIDSRIFSFL